MSFLCDVTSTIEPDVFNKRIDLILIVGNHVPELKKFLSDIA